MNPSPVVTYECHACGATFSSELGRRAHDAVCIPRNMPGQSLAKMDLFFTETERYGENDQAFVRHTEKVGGYGDLSSHSYRKPYS